MYGVLHGVTRALLLFVGSAVPSRKVYQPRPTDLLCDDAACGLCDRKRDSRAVANNRMLDDTVLTIAGDNGGTDTHTVDASNAVSAQHWRTISSAAPLVIPLVFI